MNKKILFGLLFLIILSTILPKTYAARTNEENICWQRCMANDYQDKGLIDRGRSCDSDCAGATAESIALPEDPAHRNFGEKTQCMLGCVVAEGYNKCLGKCDAAETEKMVVKKYQAICLPECRAFRDGDPLLFGRCLIGCDARLVKQHGVPYCSGNEEAEKAAENAFRKSCETQCLEDTGDFALNPVNPIPGQSKGVSCLAECGGRAQEKRKRCDFASTSTTAAVAVDTPAPPLSAVKISGVTGKVFVIRQNTAKVRPAGWDPNLPPPSTLDISVTKDTQILEGDKFRAELGGKMTINVTPGPGRPGRQVVFSRETSLQLNIISSTSGPADDKAPYLESALVIDFGRARYEAGRNRVITPDANIEPDGTKYLVTYDEEKNETRVAVLEGSVKVLPANNALSAVTVSADQELTITQSTVTPVVALSAESKTLLGESPVVSQDISAIAMRGFVVISAVLIVLFVIKAFRRP